MNMAKQHIISAKGAVMTADVNMLIKRLFTAIIRDSGHTVYLLRITGSCFSPNLFAVNIRVIDRASLKLCLKWEL